MKRKIKDIWGASFVEGAQFGKYDIPFCETTATTIPTDQVTWSEALALYNRIKSKGIEVFKYPAFVNFYEDDYKFDNRNGIWESPEKALEILKNFEGVITPDFSTYQDFPWVEKVHQTYRMRAVGFWLGKKGVPVINNIRWGTAESYTYAFEGVPQNSIVSIGTVGGGPGKIRDRVRFERGLDEMMSQLMPETILIYGGSSGEAFDKLKERGVKVVTYKSRTARAFEKGGEKYE